MTADCYQQLAQALEQGAAVLAIVTQTRGSVPREVGAKLIVCADGRVFGTIGGGAGEAKVIRQAQQVLETGVKQFVDIDLSGAPHREIQGVCGGWMQVWLECWSPENLALLQQLLDHRKTGRSATIVIPFAATQDPYLALDLALDASDLPTSEQAFLEPLQQPPTLLIVGAGHVGEQLAKVAEWAGFQVLIQDDRPDWANSQRYPQAAIFNDPIASVLDQLAGVDSLYVALVTRGYQHDFEALQALLRRDLSCKYIGMIGSEKRVRFVYQALQQAGITADRLQSIHAPIGIEIGALTPEEITISICAELIQVRRGGTGESMSAGIRGTLAKAATASTRTQFATGVPLPVQQTMQQQQ